jgi:hypothetical protein
VVSSRLLKRWAPLADGTPEEAWSAVFVRQDLSVTALDGVKFHFHVVSGEVFKLRWPHEEYGVGCQPDILRVRCYDEAQLPLPASPHLLRAGIEPADIVLIESHASSGIQPRSAAQLDLARARPRRHRALLQSAASGPQLAEVENSRGPKWARCFP